jgi:hypothetical protein
MPAYFVVRAVVGEADRRDFADFDARWGSRVTRTREIIEVAA